MTTPMVRTGSTTSAIAARMAAAPKASTYTVKSGDTFSGIAARNTEPAGEANPEPMRPRRRRTTSGRTSARVGGKSRTSPAMAVTNPGNTISRPAAIEQELGYALPHVFNHQTHHRGQVHAMLSSTPVSPPQLDEFFLAQDEPLRRHEMLALALPLR